MAVPGKRSDDEPRDFGFLDSNAARPNPDQPTGGSSFGKSSPEVNAEEASDTAEEKIQSVESKRFSEAAGTEVAVKGKPNLTQSVPGATARKGRDQSPQKNSTAVIGYAITVTLFLLFCLATGRLSLTGNHALESLPDIRPLSPNEFQKVPDGTEVAPKHVMKLGESRRFGDVIVTTMRVTREPLQFQHFQSGAAEESLTTKPVLKLWVRFENASQTYGFPPFDVGLMSKRTPEHSTDESTVANSYLTVKNPTAGEGVRVLNYLQSMDNNFVIAGQESAKVVMPMESLETFIACSEEIASTETTADSQYMWRVQFRKGINESSGNGVTTLIDIHFTGSDVVEPSSAAQPVAG